MEACELLSDHQKASCHGVNSETIELKQKDLAKPEETTTLITRLMCSLRRAASLGGDARLKSPNGFLSVRRTKLSPTAARPASISDVTEDFRRMRVFMNDLLDAMPEYQTLSSADQAVLRSKRFLPFYLLKLAQWSTNMKHLGVAYSNGTYFPSISHQQCIPDITHATKALMNASKSLRDLSVDETEHSLMLATILFYHVPGLSTAAVPHVRHCCQKFTNALITYNRQRLPENAPERLALRNSKLILIITDCMEIANMVLANLQMYDMLGDQDWEKTTGFKLT